MKPPNSPRHVAARSRPSYLVLLLTVAAVCALSAARPARFGLFERTQQEPHTTLNHDAARPGAAQQGQRCAVYSGTPWHVDVTSGLAWALQEAGCQTDIYLLPGSRGIEPLLEGWFGGRTLPHTAIEQDAAAFDAVFMVTFPEPADFPVGQRLQHSLITRRPPHQRIYVMPHNLDRLLGGAPDWVAPALLAGAMPRADRGAAGPAAPPPPLQLMAIAPFSADVLQALLQAWAADMKGWRPDLKTLQPGGLEVPWVVPLVPWSPPGGAAAAGSNRGASGGGAAPARRWQHLCIPGAILEAKRTYRGVFEAIGHPAVLARLRALNESLLLVGAVMRKHPPPEPAPEVAPHVRIVANLRFEEYFDTLSHCRAILTAFAPDSYLTNQTSSTLFVTPQVGAPLITEQRVLDMYQYYPAAAAFPYADQRPWLPDAIALAAKAGKELSMQMRQPPTMQEQRQRQQQQHRQQRQQRQRQQRLQQQQQKRQAAGDAEGPPSVGSLAAALLAALDDRACETAHAAAQQARQAVMARNVEVAGRMLREAGELAAAAAADAAAKTG